MPNNLTIHNPYTNQLVAEIPFATQADIDRVIAAAHASFELTRVQAPHIRSDLLRKIATALEQQRDAFAKRITEESGKPITLAEGEVSRAIVTFQAAADEARRTHGELLDVDAFAPGAGHFALSKRMPVGVVYGITPFNFPLNLVVHKIAPAIACGCPIIIKPSPRTPLSTIALVDLINQCGAIPGSVSYLITPNELATKPIDDARIKAVSFTGSAPIGWKIKAQALTKKVTLELGGNAAVVLHHDADIATAIPMIATGAYSNAGQSCISVQRIVVHKSIYNDVRNQLVTHIQTKIKAGDPTLRDTLVGPMIEIGAKDRALANIQSAVALGAKILAGGTSSGNVIAPTLLENAPPTASVCRDEVFAPIAVLIAYDTFEEAIKIVNDSEYGLQAGIFTRDIALIMQAFHHFEVGGVLINQVPTFRIDNLPYGGIKNSGVGREGIKYAIEDMTELRTLVIKNI